MSSDSTVPNEEEAPSNQETGVSDTMEQEQQGLSAPKDQGPPVREIPAPKLNSHKVVAANYNQRNPAVRRLMCEAQEMACSEERFEIHAEPLADNLFEWHFTFRGPTDTVYSAGIYHGRIILPSNYPMSPPEIAILTPNGRFQTSTKICLSISNHHPETWLPSWGIRTAVTALRAFMAADSPGAIGSTQCSESVRAQLAVDSLTYCCPDCGPVARQLAIPAADGVSSSTKDAIGPSGDAAESPDTDEPGPASDSILDERFEENVRLMIENDTVPPQFYYDSSDGEGSGNSDLENYARVAPEPQPMLTQSSLEEDLTQPRNCRPRSRRRPVDLENLSPRRHSATIRENLLNGELRHAAMDPNYIPQAAVFPPGQLERFRRQAERRKRVLFDVFVYLMAVITFIWFCSILYTRNFS